ncbi:MAG: trypsin-like peptidase domain-containing protein [Wenzhouxiangellaceae bacterium]
MGPLYQCPVCPLGHNTDLCADCYQRWLRGDIDHPGAATESRHEFRLQPAATELPLDRWAKVPTTAQPEPEIADGFVVRPEFCCGYDSYFGGHAFAAHDQGRTLILTALHVMDELAKRSDIDITAANPHYNGHEIPAKITEINLYNVYQTRWMLYPLGTASSMLILPDARIDLNQPCAFRDIAAFDASHNPQLRPHSLATSTPQVGEPIWLAAHSPSGLRCRQAVVVEHTSDRFIFRYLQPDWDMNATSGAPLINAEGEVVGINTGMGYDGRQRYGHANPVASIRRHLRQAKKNPGHLDPGGERSA